MNAIRNWLDDLGLGQYADAFEANDIDFALLSEVDDQARKDIGVTSAGHRLRIRSAIAKLKLSSAAATVERYALEPASTAVSAEGERRQLTALFRDMVGVTELATRDIPGTGHLQVRIGIAAGLVVVSSGRPPPDGGASLYQAHPR